MRKNHILAIAIGYTVALTIASLINIKKLPTVGFSFEDKVYHFLAYLVLAIVWVKALQYRQIKNYILKAFISTLIYGIIIEVIQHRLNPMRTYDTYDLIANCLGVVFGTFIAIKLTKSKVKIKS